MWRPGRIAPAADVDIKLELYIDATLERIIVGVEGVVPHRLRAALPFASGAPIDADRIDRHRDCDVTAPDRNLGLGGSRASKRAPQANRRGEQYRNRVAWFHGPSPRSMSPPKERA